GPAAAEAAWTATPSATAKPSGTPATGTTGTAAAGVVAHFLELLVLFRGEDLFELAVNLLLQLHHLRLLLVRQVQPFLEEGRQEPADRRRPPKATRPPEAAGAAAATATGTPEPTRATAAGAAEPAARLRPGLIVGDGRGHEDLVAPDNGRRPGHSRDLR